MTRDLATWSAFAAHGPWSISGYSGIAESASGIKVRITAVAGRWHFAIEDGVDLVDERDRDDLFAALQPPWEILVAPFDATTWRACSAERARALDAAFERMGD